jgi:predicted metalloprotease
MRWEDGRRSDNVEDRRGVGPRGLAVGGGVGTLIIVVLALIFGGPDAARQLLQNPPAAGPGAPRAGVPGQGSPPANPQEDQLKDFVSVVLADTEDVWHELFRRSGRRYQEPRLVLFTGEVQSACGFASAAVGPFYCAEDQRVYLDLRFFEELKRRFRAPGDFAQAYVIAHEIGHHVQKLMGVSDKVRALQQRASKAEANQLSVRLELQADFLAGVWAHHAQKTRHILEPGDLEEALRAATAIGDDRLQMQSRGYVVPDSFTHGTSEQRVRWFRRGWETGDITQGDTFKAARL